MNDAMGLANNGPLPDQVRRLVEATGLEIARDGTVSSGGAAASSAGSVAGTSTDSDLHTSLPGIGLAPDTKLAKSLAKHKARQTTLTAPPLDERKQKIFQYQEFLRIPPEGASFEWPIACCSDADVNEPRTTARIRALNRPARAFLIVPDDGVSTYMPSGGKSTTPSMLTPPEGSDPAEFGPFKNVATFLAASPPLRSYAPPKGSLSGAFRVT